MPSDAKINAGASARNNQDPAWGEPVGHDAESSPGNSDSSMDAPLLQSARTHRPAQPAAAHWSCWVSEYDSSPVDTCAGPTTCVADYRAPIEALARVLNTRRTRGGVQQTRGGYSRANPPVSRRKVRTSSARADLLGVEGANSCAFSRSELGRDSDVAAAQPVRVAL